MPPMQLIGRVSKAGKMTRTVTVTVDRLVVHKRTLKRMKRTKNYLVHDEGNSLRVDDVVLIRNCPPISKLKRFTVEQLLRSPEGDIDARRAAEAMQAALEGKNSQSPLLPNWTPAPPRGETTERYTPAEIAALPFRIRHLLEAQGKIKRSSPKKGPAQSPESESPAPSSPAPS